MIKIFNSTSKSFSSNGDVVIRPLSAVVHHEMDGDFYLELTVDLRYADWMERGNIIVAPTPQGNQAFRIDNPVKTPSTIETKAWHVFYDTQNMVLGEMQIENKNADEALAMLNSAVVPESPFTVSAEGSDLVSLKFEDQSYNEALTAFQATWGGHLIRDNFSISYRESIGTDRGITIEYAKNLKDITCEENWDEVCTKLLPVGTDGIKLNALDPNESKYVESEIQYSIPYVKTVQFQQEINRDDYSSDTAYQTALINDLNTQALNYIETHKLPQVNYTLEAYVEDVVADIGDMIEVKDSRLGIDLMTEVISYEYNCLTGTYDQLEFGNFTERLSNLLPMIDNKVDKIDGMGLSSNDFTNDDLDKLDGIEDGANKAEITIADNNVGAVNIGDLLIQWGTDNITDTEDITYHFAYSVAPSVQICAGDTAEGGISVISVNNTKCTVNAVGTDRIVRWCAIGKS